MAVNNALEQKIRLLQKSFEEIPAKRKTLLKETARYIADKRKDRKAVNLIFICTHNSRRSHISQIWAQTAAEYYEIPMIHCYSGGTEATAFNPRAVKAMRNAGFDIEKKIENENPVYLVSFAKEREPLAAFSKKYTHAHNPLKDFAAIMTCSDADANCPVVIGAEERFPLRYEDPKEFDGTELEEIKYQERVEQIGAEMLCLFQFVKEYVN